MQLSGTPLDVSGESFCRHYELVGNMRRYWASFPVTAARVAGQGNMSSRKSVANGGMPRTVGQDRSAGWMKTTRVGVECLQQFVLSVFAEVGAAVVGQHDHFVGLQFVRRANSFGDRFIDVRHAVPL